MVKTCPRGRRRPDRARRAGPILAVLLGAALALPPIAAAQITPHEEEQPDPLTTREMRALSAREANRTVQHDLLSILHPVEGIRRGQYRRLHGVSLVTRPTQTPFAGLCRHDVVSLKYAPVETTEEYEDQPVKPYSVEAHGFFHALSAPITARAEKDAADQVWSKECDRLDADNTANWFWAENELAAAQGVNVLQAALERVRDGSLKASSCKLYSVTKTTCEQVILDVGVATEISGVLPCETKTKDRCLVIDIPYTRLTITFSGDAESPQPRAVESISVEQYVVVS